MALRQVIRRGRGAMVSTVARSMARGGGGPPQPPFARIKPVDYQVNENHELVWNDGVAPEVCLDFDAPNVSMGEAFAWWSGGLAFFAAVFGLVALSNPESKREAVPRTATLPPTAYDPRDLFQAPEAGGKGAADDEEGEEDGEEEEEDGDEEEEEE